MIVKDENFDAILNWSEKRLGHTILYDKLINGNPNIPNRPSPSVLDLNGVTPPTYRDNAPEGASF